MSETATFQISGQKVSLAPEQVESAVRDDLPEPIHEHKPQTHQPATFAS